LAISNNHNKQEMSPYHTKVHTGIDSTTDKSVTSMLRMKSYISTNACIKVPGVLDFPRCIAYSSRDLYYQQPCTPKDLESRDLYSLLCDILP
jgi:hypothetical protein